MSASKPNGGSTEALPSVALTRRTRRKKDRDVWFLVSLALHGLALAALIYLTPVRELVQEVLLELRPEPTMSASGLAELAQAMEDLAAEQIGANARELTRVFADMSEIQEGMSGDFGAFEERRRENAARDALNEMESALEQMDSAVQSIQQDAPIEATDRFQALGEQAQERARKKLEMVQFDVRAVSAAHRSAEQTHQEAKSTHDTHGQVKGRVQALERTLAPQRATVEGLRKQLQEMKDSARPSDQTERQAQRLAEQEQRVGQLEEELSAQKSEQAELHNEEAESQRRAIAAQQEAATALREVIAQHQHRTAGSRPSQSDAAVQRTGTARPAVGPPQRPVPEQDLGQPGIDVAWLYEEARTREDTIAESFKEIRAMDLAMVRDMKLEDARHDIELVRPVRPDLDAELLRVAVRTDERFEAHTEELRTALHETMSMVNLAYRMLEMATESVEKMKFGSDVQLAELDRRPEFQLIIRELAMEDVSGRFSDMAAIMQALEEQEGEGDGADARRRPDFEDLTGESGQGPLPRFGQDGFELGDLPLLSPDLPAVGARKISPSGQPGQWMFIDSWWTLGPFPNPNRINIDREFPPDSLIDLDATYVGKDGRTIRWQFVQSEMPEIIPPNAEPYGIWYAYTEFYCDKPRDVLIALGTDDRGVLKINGLPVWISSKRLKGWSIAEVWRRVHFSKGINRMLYRVENGWQHIAFSMVLRLEDQ